MESDASLSDVCQLVQAKKDVTIFRLKPIKWSESEATDTSSSPKKKRPKKAKKKTIKKAPFKCVHCGEEFPNYDAHLYHVETKHPVPHNCPVPNCYYRTARKWYMRQHSKSVHGANAINCPIDGCGGYFVKRVLQKHIKTFHRQRQEEESTVMIPKIQQKCDHCEFSTDNARLYESHMRDFHLIGLECPLESCNGKFYADKIELHFKALHRNVKWEYSCGNGLKLLDDDEVMNDGEVAEKENSDVEMIFEGVESAKTASGFGGFNCTRCSKTFGDRRNLIRHIARVHEKRYKKTERTKRLACTIEGCEKTFACQSLLTDHLNMHNGIYPYKCDHCSQKFFARARYAVHLQKFHNRSIKDENTKESTFVRKLRTVIEA